MQHLRSAIYTVMLFLVTAFFAVVVILLMWLPPEAHYAVPRAWARTNLWLLKYLCRLDYRVEGRENVEVRYDATKPTMIPLRLIDISRAREKLGFAPKVSLEEGLRRTLESIAG